MPSHGILFAWMVSELTFPPTAAGIVMSISTAVLQWRVIVCGVLLLQVHGITSHISASGVHWYPRWRGRRCKSQPRQRWGTIVSVDTVRKWPTRSGAHRESQSQIHSSLAIYRGRDYWVTNSIPSNRLLPRHDSWYTFHRRGHDHRLDRHV